MSKSRTVYVVQDSPSKDISNAARYGKLEVLLYPRDVRKGPEQMLLRLRERMAQVQESDYLLLIGDPLAIGLVISVAFDMCDRITVLRWDRKTYKYEPVEVNYAE